MWNTTACPLGTFNANYSQSNVSACLDCRPGYVCPFTGMWNETACEPGTYNELYGQGNVSACLDCPPGYYCPTFATVNATPCEAGTYNPSFGEFNASVCDDCPAGYYCPEGTAIPSLQQQGDPDNTWTANSFIPMLQQVLAVNITRNVAQMIKSRRRDAINEQQRVVRFRIRH